MEFVYFKVILLVNSWLFVMGSPVAMLHATSSQSIVFHDTQRASSPSPAATTHGDPNGDHIPKYEYKYEVSDQETGDRKTHWESRDGDKVRGAYTLYEPDGALRTVEYTADSLHGFNAVVKRSEPSKHQFPRNSYKKPNGGNHNSYDQARPEDMPGRGAFVNEHADELSSTRKTYNQGVQFNVIH